ncbi:hypothetical protein [Pinibacter soli]|uniref:Bacteriophage Mu GpT domain-containing protein n=1 Tax=Pinibacter soli TaxID=3044211 RepID=A0ABT6RBQ1_9BACT|nr:hypothetical protein [Pinibacter soli]MDI3319984.1 hypothetical protein [Pinibacter soli]
MPKENRTIIGKQYFRATFDKNSISKEDRTVDVVFVTERQVMMYNWDIGLFYEVLPCNEINGDLGRLNNGAPLCDTHDTSSVRNGLGVVEKAWFDNGIGRATVRFSKRADVDPVWQDVQDSIITGVSVGYIVYEYEEVGVKENIPLIRANKWEGTEISLALVQADSGAGVGRAASDDVKQDVIMIRKNSNSNTMTEAEKAALAAERKRSAEILKACRAANFSNEYAQELIESERSLEEALTAINAKKSETPPVNESEVRTQATKAERTRASEISKASRAVGLPDSFAQKLIDDGTSLENARAAIIDEAAKKNPVEPKPQSGVIIGADEKDKKQRGMESSIMHRAGVLKAETAGDPGEFRSMTLMDLAKDCLTNAGINYRGLSQMEIASRALQMGSRDGGGLATGDFSYILANVLNKTLRTMYDLQARSFTQWTRKSTTSDFKQILRTQISDLKLTPVQEGGEYQYAQISDSGESYKVAKWGKIVNINWEAIVNDDLSAFSRIPSFLAGAVAQMQSDVIYAILTGSHIMGDTNELFDATNHGNYTSTGTAISAVSIGVARQMMRDQKSPGNNILNIAPKFLIVGSQNEALALQYSSQNYVATKQADINVWTGLITPIVDARISGKQWFMTADPALIDTVEYATLEGNDIYTESKYGFEVDALQYKLRTVFGAKAIDWRGMYKNTGA